eukprot:420783-Amorphochlora_amoeboformis.AAC.1
MALIHNSLVCDTATGGNMYVDLARISVTAGRYQPSGSPLTRVSDSRYACQVTLAACGMFVDCHHGDDIFPLSDVEYAGCRKTHREI